MHKYIEHSYRWDASNPVALFSKKRIGNGEIKINGAISVQGG